MTREHYIEKISERLNQLTKDELKDVSILTAAQLGVRQKLAEKERIENEITNSKSQLEKQQPEIPEVPQFVADWLDRKPLYAINGSIPVEIIEWSKKQTGYADLGMNINHLLKLKVNGYTAETPKVIVSPCPVCRYEDVKSNFCSICGHKNEYVAVEQIGVEK
ncbi:hypothetical protein [Lactococcus sp. DD01]|uniref:hypothetical protein n=1 Tax=Lactococcus sp. DD01 TaxID=1776443 RepID=UPI0007763734|nr:hypothetical protein [Lactococcus sp. DD01]KXT61401.1 hypothetical protein LACDD01_01414 [Lactococcus sp. DD01]